jgi:hypothetical protein
MWRGSGATSPREEAVVAFRKLAKKKKHAMLDVFPAVSQHARLNLGVPHTETPSNERDSSSSREVIDRRVPPYGGLLDFTFILDRLAWIVYVCPQYTMFSRVMVS